MARKAEVVSDALIKESLTDGSTRLAVSLIMRPPTICRRTTASIDCAAYECLLRSTLSSAAWSSAVHQIAAEIYVQLPTPHVTTAPPPPPAAAAKSLTHITTCCVVFSRRIFACIFDHCWPRSLCCRPTRSVRLHYFVLPFLSSYAGYL